MESGSLIYLPSGKLRKYPMEVVSDSSNYRKSIFFRNNVRKIAIPYCPFFAYAGSKMVMMIESNRTEGGRKDLKVWTSIHVVGLSSILTRGKEKEGHRTSYLNNRFLLPPLGDPTAVIACSRLPLSCERIVSKTRSWESVCGGQTTLAGSLGHLTQLRSNERVNIVRIWQQKMLGERSVISSLKAFTVSMGRQPCRQSVMNFRVISLHPHADPPLPMAGY